MNRAQIPNMMMFSSRIHCNCHPPPSHSVVIQGQHEPDDYKLNLVAKLPLAVANSASRTLFSNHRRAEQSEEDDDLEDFIASLGGTNNELGGDGKELGGGDFDLLSAFGGGLGGTGDDELGLGGGGLDFFSAFGFGGEDGNAMGGFGDDPVLSDIMENMEQCGIDIPDMTSKVFEAIIMSGAGGFDFTSPESFQSVGSTAILLALKDEDEEDCDGADTAEVLLASEEFLQCSGE